MVIAKAWISYALLMMSYANAKDTFEANFREASQLLPKDTCESIIVSSRVAGNELN